MAKYQKILVAIDLSPETEKILGQAIELSRQNGAELSLINVVEHVTSIYDTEFGFPETPNIEQDLSDKAMERLEQVKQEHQISDAKSFVRIGAAKHEIVNLAHDLDADLIVIGSHGRHGLQLLLGSTANGVMHLATCDVLAVRVGQD